VRTRRLCLVVLLVTLTLGVVVTAPAVGTAAEATKHAAIPFTAATVTQTADGYDVAWKAPTSAGAVKVYAGTDPTSVGTSDEVGSGKSTGSAHVTGLAVAPRWYFELVPAKGGSLVTADRSLHLSAAPNFRDMGGYRTREGKWVKVGLLYRADALDKLTDADLATVDALGVKLVCDLRTNTERAKQPDREITGALNEQIDISGQDELTQTITAAITSGDKAEQQRLFGDGKGAQLLIDGARAFVSGDVPQAGYRSMFERVADRANLPTILHCTGGKDRTGWAAAAVLTLLGVPKATVMQDYLLSNDNLKAKNEATLAQTGALIDSALLEPLIGVRKEYLDASFTEVKSKYKTFDKYLVAIGVTKADAAQLKAELLAG
jgi:protein-tyrosine phosphatase